ncbi:MAG: hypothetical protein Q9218_008145 [Villophora microphyllina]
MISFLYEQGNIEDSLDCYDKDDEVQSPRYIVKALCGLIVKALCGLIDLGDKYDIPSMTEYAVMLYEFYASDDIRTTMELLDFVPYLYGITTRQRRKLQQILVRAILVRPGRILLERNRSMMLEHMRLIPEFREDVSLGLLNHSAFAVQRDVGLYTGNEWRNPKLRTDGEGTAEQYIGERRSDTHPSSLPREHPQNLLDDETGD